MPFFVYGVDKKTGEIIEGLQIFYTTHSPNFLRTDKFDEIHIVRKTKDEGTYCSEAKVLDFVVDLKERKGIISTEDETSLHFKTSDFADFCFCHLPYNLNFVKNPKS